MWCIFLFPCQKQERIFQYSPWETGWAPGSKIHKSMGTSLTGSLEFLTLRLFYVEPPAICQSQFRFSYHTILVSQRYLLVDFCSGKLWFLVYACLSLQIWGQQFDLWLCFFDEYKKSCWFFSLFSLFHLLLGLSDDFQTPHARLETRSLYALFNIILLRYNLYNIKLTHLQVYNSIIFSKFIQLYNNHHNKFWSIFNTPKSSLVLTSDPYSHHHLLAGIHWSTVYLYKFAFSWHLIKWDHSMYSLLCLASVT